MASQSRTSFVITLKCTSSAWRREAGPTDLFGIRHNHVGQPAILDDELVSNVDLTDRGDEPRTDVAEPILVVPERNVRRHPHGMVGQKVALP